MKILLTITGPSGAGKDTLLDALLVSAGVKSVDGVNKISAKSALEGAGAIHIRELISHTTRAPRNGEVDGIAYHFVDLPTFNKIRKVEETEYAGNHYCLSEDEIISLADGDCGAVIVDQHGVACIRDFVNYHFDEYIHVKVFLKISAETSERRMRDRGDKPNSIERRLKQQKERGEYSPKAELHYDFILSSETADDLSANVEIIQKAIKGE